MKVSRTDRPHLLKPEASRDEIRKLCQEAARSFRIGVHQSLDVPLAAEMLRGQASRFARWWAFPWGDVAAGENHEAEEAIKLGAQEIDMVINIGASKSGKMTWWNPTFAGSWKPAIAAAPICKVILETALLTIEEKVRGSAATKRAGADS